MGCRPSPNRDCSRRLPPRGDPEENLALTRAHTRNRHSSRITRLSRRSLVRRRITDHFFAASPLLLNSSFILPWHAVILMKAASLLPPFLLFSALLSP